MKKQVYSYNVKKSSEITLSELHVFNRVLPCACPRGASRVRAKARDLRTMSPANRRNRNVTVPAVSRTTKSSPWIQATGSRRERKYD